MKNQLSNNLIALMELHRIGGAQLARAIKIPLSTIKNIRSGGHINPTIETLAPLARYFEVSMDDIVNADLTTKQKKNYAKTMPQPVPVITWAEAVSWPANILSDKQIFTENSCKEVFALSSNQDFSDMFIAPGIFLIDTTLQPNHLDYVLVHKNGLDRASIRQFIRDEDRCYFKSLVINNNLVECNQGYRLLGIITEYRQIFKSYDDKSSHDFVSYKKINKLILMEE